MTASRIRCLLASLAAALPLGHKAVVAQGPQILFDPTCGVSSTYWVYQSLVVGDLDGQNGLDACIPTGWVA